MSQATSDTLTISMDPLRTLSPPPSTTSSHSSCDTENIDPETSLICDHDTTLPCDNMPNNNTTSPSTYFANHNHYHNLTIDASIDAPSIVINHDHLPLSPSMTPPIVLSPTSLSPSSSCSSEGEDEEESCLEEQEQQDDQVEAPSCSEPESSIPSASNSPLRGDNNVMVDEDSRSPPKSFVRARSLRRSQRSFTPYSQHSRGHNHNHQGVLRPINQDVLDSSRLLKTTCDITLTTVTTQTAPQTTIDSEDSVDVDSKSSSSEVPSSHVHVHHQQLHIDTHLANVQSLESRAAKTALAHRLLSVIRADDFDNFLTILRHQKPDLNVFVDGQTALHYCLMLGRDVSWCKQLVLNGANPNLSNQDGWHPLHLAAFRGLNENLNYLISCNSPPTTTMNNHNHSTNHNDTNHHQHHVEPTLENS